MKNFKLNIAYLAVFVMIFSSCSKEETGVQNLDPEKATLSFGALLNDLTTNRAANKAHLGFLDGVPECSEGTADYVIIGLSLDGESIEWANGEERLRVDLVDGQIFTEENSELELIPDEYVLEFFAVYNESGTMLWLAPRGGDDDDLSGFVNNALPLSIDLRAGVKKYVEVDVLCYDDRFVNEYGYLFFEINENEAITFCIFGNYCDDAGRHYPASYSVSIWSGTSSSGAPLYTNVPNVTNTYDNGDAYAEPLCFALPDTSGEDEYYFEITLLNSDAYGDVTVEVIRSGVITDADVRALNNQDDNTTEYYHFREGNCNLGDIPNLLGDGPDNGNGNGGTPDSDGDGVPDSKDECPNTPSGTAVDAVGCPVDTACDQADPNADCDNDGILNRCDENNPNYGSFDCDGDGFLNGVDACPNEAGVAGGEGGDGCPADTGTEDCTGLSPACVLNTEGALGENCTEVDLEGANNQGWVKINSAGELDLIGGLTDDEDFGDVSWTVTAGGDLTVTIDGELAEDRITAYAVEVRPSYSDGTMSATCWESTCANLGAQGTTNDVVLNFDVYDYSYPFFIKVSTVICGVPVGTP